MDADKITVGIYSYVRPDAKVFGPLEIDDLIEEWHNNHSITEEMHEYLGMTWEEYCEWASGQSR